MGKLDAAVANEEEATVSDTLKENNADAVHFAARFEGYDSDE